MIVKGCTDLELERVLKCVCGAVEMALGGGSRRRMDPGRRD